MNRYNHLKEKAKKLRRNGYTLNDICAFLNKKKGTVWYWIKDTPVEKTNIFIKRKKKNYKKSSMKAGDVTRKKFEKLHEDTRRLASTEWEKLKSEEFKQFIMCYWCEGTKRGKHKVSICNSDPRMIEFINKWMNKINYNNKPILAAVQIHEDQNAKDVVKFWSGIIKIPIKIFKKSNSGKMEGRNWNSKYGVLSLHILDSFLKTKIDTWINILAKELVAECRP